MTFAQRPPRHRRAQLAVARCGYRPRGDRDDLAARTISDRPRPGPAAVGSADFGTGDCDPKRPAGTRVRVRLTHRLATPPTSARCGRQRAGACPCTASTRFPLADARETPAPGALRAARRPLITPTSRRSGHVEACYAAPDEAPAALDLLSARVRVLEADQRGSATTADNHAVSTSNRPASCFPDAPP